MTDTGQRREWQRCKGCGKEWRKYNPTSVLGVLGLWARLPLFWFHFRFACPKGKP
jgi:hypothetical protein